MSYSEVLAAVTENWLREKLTPKALQELIDYVESVPLTVRKTWTGNYFHAHGTYRRPEDYRYP